MAGRWLIAHELTHVIQQRAASPETVSRQGPPFDDEFEEAGEEPDAEGDQSEDQEDEEGFDPCADAARELEKILDIESCRNLTAKVWDHRDLIDTEERLENERSTARNALGELTTKKKEADQNLAERQEAHDEALAPILEQQAVLQENRDHAYAAYLQAVDAFDQAHRRYWSKFNEISLGLDKKKALYDAFVAAAGAEPAEPPSLLDVLGRSVELFILFAAYAAQAKAVDKQMAAFQAEWPAWADEQARLEKAENDARDAFNLADFALSQSIAETSALAAKDPTRASQQLAAEMATVEERLRDLASQEKENSDRLETMSKKVEDDGEACAKDQGLEDIDGRMIVESLNAYTTFCRE
jgi:hypothetical protein